MCVQGRLYRSLLAVVDMLTARERARSGDRDGAIPLLREVVDELFHAGQLWTCIRATAFLVETLLERGAGDDVAEAKAAIDRLAATTTGWLYARSGCFRCAHYSLKPSATTPPTATIGIATAR